MNKIPHPESSDQTESDASFKKSHSRRDLLVAGSAAALTLSLPSTVLAQALVEKFKRIPIQYIAALGDPQSSSGNNAHEWGIWPLDPGPRGVDLDDYPRLRDNGGVAPDQWQFDNEDWWLEEHGLIMEAPDFPMPAGRYIVTGDREIQAILTVEAPAADGSQQWELDNDASIYDVTHLRCRSGRYTPTSNGYCSPASANKRDFPVAPGADMPGVDGCNKLDYQVLIITAVSEDNV